MCSTTQVSVDCSRVGISSTLSQAEPFSGISGQAKRWGTCDIQSRAKQCLESVCGPTAAAGYDCSIHREVKRKIKRYRIYGDKQICARES